MFTKIQITQGRVGVTNQVSYRINFRINEIRNRNTTEKRALQRIKVFRAFAPLLFYCVLGFRTLNMKKQTF